MSLSTPTARALLATTLAAALLATSGCSVFHRPDGSIRFLPHRHNSDYSKSRENRPLEVPPDLDTPATDPSMQIPSTRGAGVPAAASTIAPDSGNPSFTVADTAEASWARLGRALERIDGVSITQRAQLLGSYEVQYKGATILLRASAEGAQSTRVDAVGADGRPIRSAQAIELLGVLHSRIG